MKACKFCGKPADAYKEYSGAYVADFCLECVNEAIQNRGAE